MKKITFFLCALLISAMSFAETYSHTFKNGELKTGTVTLSDVSWATTMAGSTYYGWDSNNGRGIQLGKSKEACTSYSLTTSHFADYMVTNITVNASIASDGKAKMQVSVGGVDYISQTNLTTSANDYTGAGSSSGDVVISFTNTSKAFYIKSISITYQAVSAGEGMILVDQSNVDFGKITKTQTITVTGQNLNSAINAELQDGSNFSVEGTLTAEGGELTVNYIATEAGKHTDVLVLTSDDVTTEVALAGEVLNLEGAGTKENPYTVADILALNVTDQTKAWVQGYIIGALNSDNSNKLETTGTTVPSNIVLASTADATDNYIPVALPSGDARNALNLSANPTNLGIKVAVYGTLELYFSKAGVKNVSDYVILTAPVVNHTINVSANPDEAGTVTGGGNYEHGAEANLTAIANEGYEFVNWTEGEEVVSTNAEYTFEVLADRNLVANFIKKTISYELNGGAFPKVKVPTNEELALVFKQEYAEYFAIEGLTDTDMKREVGNFIYVTNSKGGDAIKFITENANWKWLHDYILTVAGNIPEGTNVGFYWRANLDGFFHCKNAVAVGGVASADYTEAGKPEAWGAAYQAAHAVVLPTEPVDAPYTLPTPVKEGYKFVGWYDNAEGTGEAYTVIPAGWAGTLYAIWEQGTTTALENIAVEGKAVKAIINGQLIIIKNGVQYNALGQVIR